MKQIALDIGMARGPTMAGFFAGPNEAALKHLQLWAGSPTRSPVPTYLWGASGSGKTHLLKAVAESLREHGVDLPVHLGVAGPAKITTLIKYAAMCGVGNSISFLKKNALSLTALATSHSPEGVVGPIEQHAIANPASAIKQIHIFPFGGLKKSSEWLVDRGSWKVHNASHTSANAAAS